MQNAEIHIKIKISSIYAYFIYISIYYIYVICKVYTYFIYPFNSYIPLTMYQMLLYIFFMTVTDLILITNYGVLIL